jgi:hypothetical protein
MAVSMAERYGSSGQLVNVSPVHSSVRVMRAPGRLPYSPIQRVYFWRAVSSLAHQPCCMGWPAEVRRRWYRWSFNGGPSVVAPLVQGAPLASSIEHMTDLPIAERLARHRTVEAWLVWQLEQTRRTIRELEQAAGQPVRYVIEPKQNPKHPQPALVHLATCTMPQRATLPVDAGEARIGLTKDSDNVAACPFCAPGKTLGLDG